MIFVVFEGKTIGFFDFVCLYHLNPHVIGDEQVGRSVPSINFSFTTPPSIGQQGHLRTSFVVYGVLLLSFCCMATRRVGEKEVLGNEDPLGLPQVSVVQLLETIILILTFSFVRLSDALYTVCGLLVRNRGLITQ